MVVIISKNYGFQKFLVDYTILWNLNPHICMHVIQYKHIAMYFWFQKNWKYDNLNLEAENINNFLNWEL